MQVDAVVVGAGPNGLTAAITLARAGLDVHLYEARSTVGGGARTEELTLPGFRHDPCSAVHPLGLGSPVFGTLPLAAHGLDWVHPPVPVAQTNAAGPAIALHRSLEQTTAAMGVDAQRYRAIIGPHLGHWADLARDVLRPPLAGLPRHPVQLGRFGVAAVQPGELLVRRFATPGVRALFAGLGAHGLAPLRSPVTAGTALMFAVSAHDVGWPMPRGGSQAISDALAGYFRSLGGQLHLDTPVTDIAALPSARAYLFDVSPRALVDIAGARLSARWVRRMSAVRYGPAVFKVDYALDGPVPWTDELCRQAGTVHVAGGAGEIGRSLRAVNAGHRAQPPFLITAQPSLVDDTRAPAGKHVFWTYGQVPNGWPGDALPDIEAAIERFAPGFTDLVLGRHVITPAQSELRNSNNIGGNIAVGRADGLRGLIRPVFAPRVPYATGNPSIYLCSSATTPGPGVHGMCGYHAAAAALRRVWHLPAPPLA